ncbi:thioredoxin domain-containing protein [Streptomyces broussonetiae]|uniref:Thioredoxin domain-containing protein n=1 Tax=Streptomyces broussonetiae TaxID=2686304 RepID=A0A6I6N6E3_9ACTN|nr:thioredoxin domain-containing protein [Streptomyces broussonetiae]QHA04097.1 thioredoxin domain-containing protein [Streptomyces broussonetiae]
MSEKNRDGKRTARERLAVEREKQKAAEKRRRTLIVGASVVCVLGLAAVIGVVAANSGKNKSEKAGPVVVPSGAQGKDSLAIPVGKDGARSTLTIWEDMRCPACQAFEVAYRPTLHELVDAEKLRIEYHLVRLIDGNLGGTGSLRGANAVACAQDAGKFRDYHDVLYTNQPKETDDAYSSNAKLIELAGKVKGLDTPAFQKCVNDGTHDSWVNKAHKAFQSGGFTGTPTVLLGGKNIYNDRTMTPAKLKQMVEAANHG